VSSKNPKTIYLNKIFLENMTQYICITQIIAEDYVRDLYQGNPTIEERGKLLPTNHWIETAETP